jgi:hypothetical protein
MRRRFIPAKIAALSLLLGMSGTSLAVVPDPASPEYLANWGVRAIGVQPVWATDATGQGVTVALLDTGTNGSHVDLASQLLPGSTMVDVDNQGGHGSSIAGIIAGAFNNVGMVGIAYNAKLLSLGIADENRTSTPVQTAAGFNAVSGRPDVRVINLSVTTGYNETNISAINTAIQRGKLIVMFAGNTGGGPVSAPPAVYNMFNGGKGILVGAAGAGGALAPISAQAGAAANVFMVAPGAGVVGPSNKSDTGLTTWTGTSVAAGHVAGAAALLLSHTPDLTAQQVGEILLTTATDRGAPGVDPVYGHGLLNVASALQPIGETESSSSSGGGMAAVAGAIAVGGLGYWWYSSEKAKKELENTLIFDSYNRPYIMDLTSQMSVRDSSARLFDVMDMFDRQTRSVMMPVTESLSLTMHASATNPSDYIFLKDSDPFIEDDEELYKENLALRLDGNFNNGLFFNLQSNQRTGSSLQGVQGASLANEFVWSRSLTSPYLGFGSLADSATLGFRPAGNVALSVSANRIDEDERFGLQSQATMFSGSYAPTERTNLTLNFSQLIENGSLLGGASGGVFSVDKARTMAIGLRSDYRVNDKLTLFANYTHGFTSVDEARGSFFQDFSALGSQAYGLGIIGSDLLRYRDRAGLALSRPLRVTAGDVDLVVPHGLDGARNPLITSTRVALDSDHAETDLEAFYRMSLDRHTDIGAHLTYRDHPNHNPELDRDIAVFGTLGLHF